MMKRVIYTGKSSRGISKYQFLNFGMTGWAEAVKGGWSFYSDDLTVWYILGKDLYFTLL
jgi:hypothetical protein